MGQIMEWVLENVSWIFSGIGLLLVGAMGRWIFNKKPSSSVTPLDPTSFRNIAANGSLAVNGSITASANNGSTAIVTTDSVTIGISLAEYEAGLRKKEQEVREELRKLGKDDTTKYTMLIAELAAAQSQLVELKHSYQEQKIKFAEAVRSIKLFKRDLPPSQIKKAQQSLARGDMHTAEAILSEVLSRSKNQASKAAHLLGFLAEQRISFDDAYRNYNTAVRLDSENSIYLNAAAKIAFTLARYKEAESLFKKVVEIHEKAGLRKSSIDVAISLNNLAALYDIQGRYSEAEPIYLRALELLKKVCGPNDIKVAQTLNNFAGLYKYHGKLEQALPLYDRALKIVEGQLGTEHPDVSTVLNNIGALRHAQGKYADAKSYYERALSIREKVYGHNHPFVGQILNNLAEVYRVLGRYKEASPKYQRALEIAKETFGPSHPHVAVIWNNLGELYREQGRYSESEDCHQEAYSIRQRFPGAEPLTLAQTLSNLGRLYCTTGRESEAEPLLQEALAIWTKALPDNHPDLAVGYHSLAELNFKLNRLDDAEKFYKRALEIRERAIGIGNPQVAETLIGLVDMYTFQSRFTEAESLCCRAVSLIEKTLGANHQQFKDTAHKQVSLLFSLGHEREAVLLKARIDETVRAAIARTMAEEMIQKQNLSLSQSEKELVEQQLEVRLQYPDHDYGPITITRQVSGGSVSSSPITSR